MDVSKLHISVILPVSHYHKCCSDGNPSKTLLPSQYQAFYNLPITLWQGFQNIWLEPHKLIGPTVKKEIVDKSTNWDQGLPPFPLLPPLGNPERATVHIDRRFQSYTGKKQRDSVMALERKFQPFFVISWCSTVCMFLSRQNSKSLEERDAKSSHLQFFYAPPIFPTGMQTNASKWVGSASCKLQRSAQASLLLTSLCIGFCLNHGYELMNT